MAIRMIPMAFVFVGAIGVALLVTQLVIRSAHALRLYDRPGGVRHIHCRPVARLGGIAVFAATVIGVVAAETQNPSSPAQQRFFLAILLGGGSVFLAGLLDDLKGLSAIPKLTVECGAALIVCLLGLEIDVIGLGPVGTLSTGELAVPLTVLWIVGVTNAFNLVDGLDGLATGIAIVALATVLATAVVIGNGTVAVCAVALLGALLGFGRYNLPPAKIFLGDSGSLFVGFFLAVLSVEASIKSTTIVLLVVPLCAVAIPLIDMSLAILRRWLRGSPIFRADARHMHHRLLALGLRPEQAALVLVLGAGAFALIGVTILLSPQVVQLPISLIGGGAALALAMSGVRRLKYDEFDEAAAAVADVFQTRHCVHARIYARETASRIAAAKSRAQLDDILRESAATLRYERMEFIDLDRQLSVSAYTKGGADAPASEVWVLEYPVSRDDGGRATHVLSIASDVRCAPRTYGAERIAHVIAPSLKAWLTRSRPAFLDAEVPFGATSGDAVPVRASPDSVGEGYRRESVTVATTTGQPAAE
jgi:UDP-GlcNAc:undecaprenyl-phosphate GlcNAc-1-phosphate transferase